MTDEPRRFTRGRLSRGAGLRKTTGCLTCRRRHIKCDEGKPHCGGCARKDVQCDYAKPEGTFKPKPDLKPKPKNSRRSRSQVESEDGICDGNIVPSVSPNDSEQPQSLAELSEDMIEPFPHLTSYFYDGPSPTRLPSYPLAPSYGGQSELAPVPKPGESPTSRWLDLLIADANDWASSELYLDSNGLDIFGNSVAQTRAGSPAESSPGPPQQRVDDGHNCLRFVNTAPPLTRNTYLVERTPCNGHQLREEQAWAAQEPIELRPSEHILFRHFVEHISRWMDLFDPQRPFGTLVPHLALHNVGLMNAILAVSARHLSIVNHDIPTCADGFRPDPSETIRFYYKTLQYSQQAMRYESYKTSLELLSSAIIISSYEMLDGSSSDWGKHLRGVFWIQRSQVIHGDSGGLRQAVWWAWLCQDTWAAFREQRKPFTFWRPMRALIDLNPNELAARSVYNLAQVVGFIAKDTKEAIVSKEKQHETKAMEADRLLRILEEWKSYLTAEFDPLPISAIDAGGGMFPPMWIQPASFAVSMQVYYSALILLHLHRPCSGGLNEYINKQRQLKNWATAVCGIASTIKDYASSAMSSQCIFIAGMVIEDDRQRSEVQNLLIENRRRGGWPGYRLDVELQEIWQKGI